MSNVKQPSGCWFPLFSIYGLSISILTLLLPCHLVSFSVVILPLIHFCPKYSTRLFNILGVFCRQHVYIFFSKSCSIESCSNKGLGGTSFIFYVLQFWCSCFIVLLSRFEGVFVLILNSICPWSCLVVSPYPTLHPTCRYKTPKINELICCFCC